MESYQQKNLNVSIMTHKGEPNMRVMNGRALLDVKSRDMKFVENPPRNGRSIEVGRTAHARYVRRPDGLYTVTMRLDASSKYLREMMTAEVAEIAKDIVADYKQKKLEKDGNRFKD